MFLGDMPTDPLVGTHATITLLPSPHPHLKILYETLLTVVWETLLYCFVSDMIVRIQVLTV